MHRQTWSYVTNKITGIFLRKVHAAGVFSMKLLLPELYEGSSFVVKLVSELAIRDGGHCLHVFGTRLFTCKVSVAYLFLLGVGGSDWWFGTSVEDTVELPRRQGSLPVKPEA